MDKVTLINRALGFLGERSITNPDAPETPAGKHMVDMYDQCRREVLRRYAWNFAEVWSTCNITTAPPYKYDDAYSLPEDYLRLLWVGDPDYPTRDYRLLNQGSPNYRKVIALNNDGASTLQIAYSADISLLSMWDPLAIKVFALWLAVDAGKAVTGQDAHVKLLNDLLSEELKDAVGVDGQEQAVLMHVTSAVQDARDQAQYGDTSGWTVVEGYS